MIDKYKIIYPNSNIHEEENKRYSFRLTRLKQLLRVIAVCSGKTA